LDLLSLNSNGGVLPEMHPLFDVKARKAQTELQTLNEKDSIYFCGSYFRYGFHEDALMSAVELCRSLSRKSILK
jgi:uncharacterized protein